MSKKKVKFFFRVRELEGLTTVTLGLYQQDGGAISWLMGKNSHAEEIRRIVDWLTSHGHQVEWETTPAPKSPNNDKDEKPSENDG